MGTDPLARVHRSQETHLVETVVHPHHHTFGGDADTSDHWNQAGKRQETVSNGTAERRLCRRFLIHVNELVVVGAIGKLIDTLLAQLNPGAGFELVADVRR